MQEGAGAQGVTGPGGEPRETRSVRLLCTVFDLGTNDLASVEREKERHRDTARQTDIYIYI